MKTILVDVDTQFDFVDPEGALFVASASVVEAAIISALTRAQTSGQPILGSVDSHSYDAWEFAGNGGPFPPHCVKGTPGWLRVTHQQPATAAAAPPRPRNQGFGPFPGSWATRFSSAVTRIPPGCCGAPYTPD